VVDDNQLMGNNWDSKSVKLPGESFNYVLTMADEDTSSKCLPTTKPKLS
jgi:hypothetical protein